MYHFSVAFSFYLVYNVFSVSGCGPVGRALDLGSRCREFESPHSDQTAENGICYSLLFFSDTGRFEQSNARLLRRLACCRLDGSNSLCYAKCITVPNLPTRTKQQRIVFAILCCFLLMPGDSNNQMQGSCGDLLAASWTAATPYVMPNA